MIVSAVESYGCTCAAANAIVIAMARHDNVSTFAGNAPPNDQPSW